jgi:hypothetical protein
LQGGSSSFSIQGDPSDIVNYCDIWLDTASDIFLGIASTRVKGKAATLFHERSMSKSIPKDGLEYVEI